MQDEQWRDVPGFEGRYQVSDLGRVKSLPFMQRYLLRTGVFAFRLKKEKIRKLKKNNSGYLTVGFCLDYEEETILVHRLVAQAFIPGTGETVNHKNGVKTNNKASNLEWATYTENHMHAVELGLNKQAIKVVDPATGVVYHSISQASKGAHVGHRTVRAKWARV